MRDKYTFKEIIYNETKDIILNYHYAQRMPSISYAFDCYEGDELIGVVTSVSIFKCTDDLLGIRLPSKLYSESSEWYSLYSGIEFYDVDEVMEVSYKIRRIKNK